jgi:hypothetical protein
VAEVQKYDGKTPEMKTYRCYELQQKQNWCKEVWLGVGTLLLSDGINQMV